MKLSFSNIGWDNQDEEQALSFLQQQGFTGLEIAPTKVFSENPYEKSQEVSDYAEQIRTTYGMTICSMQSIWNGRTESIFGSDSERQTLLDYTVKAFAFAQRLGCRNLVFGCPRNRNIPQGITDTHPAEEFFQQAAKQAVRYGCVFALEANPTIYHVNYLNTTQEVFSLAERLDCEGLGVNLDIGTMIQNQESLSVLEGHSALISHVHISEPYLAEIASHPLHRSLSDWLQKENYRHFISVEMKTQPVEMVKRTALYLKEVFG